MADQLTLEENYKNRLRQLSTHLYNWMLAQNNCVTGPEIIAEAKATGYTSEEAQEAIIAMNEAGSVKVYQR